MNCPTCKTEMMELNPEGHTDDTIMEMGDYYGVIFGALMKKIGVVQSQLMKLLVKYMFLDTDIP